MQAGPRLGYVHFDDNDGVGDLHWPLLTGRLTGDMLEAMLAVLDLGNYAAGWRWSTVKTIPGIGSPVSVVLTGGGKGYVTSLDGVVGVLDTSLNSVTQLITTPAPAAAAALSADGTVLLVAHTDDTVTAIDTATNTVIATLQTDPSPDAAGTPGLTVVGNTFYLTDSTDNVLRTVNFQGIATTQ